MQFCPWEIFFKSIYALKTYLLSNEEGMTLCWTKLNFKIDQIQHVQYLTENNFLTGQRRIMMI